MTKLRIKKKYIFLGDTDSINIELIIKSFDFLKTKVNYIIFCNKKDLLENNYFKKKKLNINQIFDPINFTNYNKNKLNVFNIENVSEKKYLNLLNQIKISNTIAKTTKYDLITMPINKSIFKKKLKFTGMTEYLGKLNHTQTLMLMFGNKFSIIPMTTHINLKNVSRNVSLKSINFFIKEVLSSLSKSNDLKYKYIKFLCINPHCSEEGTLGNEDNFIKNIIKNYKKIDGPIPADSAFLKIKKNTLYLSTYHDQALIPFKIMNEKSINITLGLNYRRISPSHGTAVDIKNKSKAVNTSYLECLLF